MPALRELQQAVYRSLVEHDYGDAAAHIRADGPTAADRLSIYRPYLPDVARLEWAVSRALHALDATPFDCAALSRSERRP